MEQNFYEIDSKNAWAETLQQIRSESGSYNFTYKDARKSENKNLNRYRDVSPYDHSRVRLTKGGEDYINASLVEVPAAKRAYILTQGPLPTTTGHFWLMIWEQKTKAVLMLNRIIEKNMVKCHQYWPLGNEHDGEEEMILKEVNLKVSIHGEKEATDYIIRELLLTNLESYESRTVLHFHYTTWPDFGVPESPSAFLSFLLAVRDSGALNQNVGPVVVHCSAGIGRSGTFCLVDSCLVLIEERGNLDAVNVQEILLEMRKYRMGLIQTPDQLRFSYLAIIEGAKQVLARRKNISENVLSDHHQNSLDGQHEDEQVNTVSSNEPKGVKRKTEFLKKEVVKEVSESKINQGISENDWDETEPLPLIPQNKPSSDTLEERKLSYISERTVSSLTSLDTANQEPKNTEFAEEDETITNNTVSIANLSSATEKNVNDSEIRKRKRRERIDKTAETVQKMRQKLQDSESWERHKLLLKKCSIGAVLLLGMGYLVYRYYVQG